ncbi:hypothetical protein KSP35_09580 [Aquihabitans sp. G128]|uniref:hypothetical protein n=1 Tax=Aquihabitans sp. G128 TaxID=2849779 RepID=UPI001C241475|nr:hypothetical protein [Aquihabitans sp. G128]QXC63004.1 hypothetical protein KSP35_09580 [Aquihabitans sp. G128]
MLRPFPAPDRLRCPVCDATLAAARCGRCGADLAGSAGDELWRIDADLHRLSVRRVAVVDGLRQHADPASAEATTTATPGGAVAPGWQSAFGPQPAAPPAGTWAPGAAPAPASPWTPPPYPGGRSPAAAVPGPGPDTSSLLLGLGTALLVVAALVFAAVSWSRIGAVGQGLLLVGLTGGVAFATDRSARRGLVGTAEALGVLTVVLGPLVAQAVRITADLPASDERTWSTWVSWTWWPAAIVVIGAAAVAFGRKVGVRSPQLLGVTLVQVGLPVWVLLSPASPLVMATVIALQALAVLGLPAWAERGTSQGAVWAVGGVSAGVAAALLALGGQLRA